MHDTRLTLAAEYLLLLLDDAKGKLVIDSTVADFGLCGAVLLDLIAQGHLALDEGSSGRDTPATQKLRLVGAGPADAVLAEARERVDGRTFGSAVEKLSGWIDFRSRGKSLRLRELHRLVDVGILAEEQAKVLGVFPVDRYPARDDAIERTIRARVEAVLVDRAQPDERTGALVSLLHATGALPKVFPRLDKRELKRRGKEVSEGDWAGAEVKKAIDNMMLTISAIVVATSAATTAST